MNSKIRFGIILSVVWLIFQLILFVGGSMLRSKPLIENNLDILGLALFVLVTSILWFYIGYKLMSKYIEELRFYEEIHTNVDKVELKKEFIKYFIFKRSKLLGFLFLTAIPWYILSPLRTNYSVKDYIILSIFLVIAMMFFYLYFRGRKTYIS